MTIDDEVRSMLRRRADDVSASPSPAAWDEIQSRLASDRRRRRWPVVAAAAAVVVLVAGGLVVSSDGDGDDGPSVVAEGTDTTTTTMKTWTTPRVWLAPEGLSIEHAAIAYAADRTGVWASDSMTTMTGPTRGSVELSSGVETEVRLQQVEGRWVVDSASSDLVVIEDPVFDDGVLSYDVVVRAGGTLIVNELEERVEPGERLPFQESISDEDRRWADASAVLRTDDGTVALAATWVDPSGPAREQGELVSLWPTVGAAGLADLQADADAGRRGDLLEPEQVAAGFLAEYLGETDVNTEPFRQGDNTSGEVGYVLSTGEKGIVLVRRDGGEGAIWRVTNVVSDTISVADTEQDGEVLRVTADVPMGEGTYLDATAVLDGGRISGGRSPLDEHEATSTVEVSDAAGARGWVVIRLLDEQENVLAIASALLA